MKKTVVVGVVLLAIASCNVPAAVFTWKLGSGETSVQSKWSRPANWDPNGPPGVADSARFSNTGSLMVEVDTASSVNDLSFGGDALPFTFSGLALTVGSGGITNDGAQVQTINNLITLGAPQVWNAASGNLTFGGGISGASDLTLRGGGGKTIVFAAATSYSGKTLLNDGATLRATVAGALGSTSQIDLDGLLQIQAGLSLNTLAAVNLGPAALGNGALTIENGSIVSFGALTVKGNTSLNLPGGTSGSITLASADRTGGTLTINGWVNNSNRDKIFVTGTAATSFLSNVNFTGFTAGGQMVGGELMPVPEPLWSTAFSALGLGLFAFLRRSARLKRARVSARPGSLQPD